MMTRTHGVSGVAVWMTGDIVAQLTHIPLPRTVVLAGAIATYVAAKAPDVDHPDSRPGHILNRVLPGAPYLINRLLGHRGVTHWAITGIFLGILVGLVGQTIPDGVLSIIGGLITGLLVMRAIRRFRRRLWSVGIIVGIIISATITITPTAIWGIGVAVTVGWTTHILGDCLTYQGAPALGPFTLRPVRTPYGYRFPVGGTIETGLVYPTVLTWAIVATVGSIVLTVFN
jgi:membrane-bound metal-dependent hydrolase YbcI (DUF457 family)